MPLIAWVVMILTAGVGITGLWIRLKRAPVFPSAESLITEPDLVKRMTFMAHGKSRKTAANFLNMEGGVNFRDIGGYPTADGRTIREGLVYRSGTLTDLTELDWQRIDSLGITLICDMRSPEELALHPERIPIDTVKYEHLPLQSPNTNLGHLRTLLFSPQKIADVMPDLYTRVMIDENPAVFGKALKLIANAENLPVLIHCTAGKDRTGVTMALLMHILGVPEEIIIADYTLSNYYFETFRDYAAEQIKWLVWLRITTDHLIPLLTADATIIRLTLNHIKDKYGSVDAYLRDYADVDDATRARLQSHLLS